MDEFQVGQRRRAVADHPGVELLPQRPVHPVVLVAEPLPARPVRGGIPGEGGRHIHALDLQRVAGHDPHERNSRRKQRGEADDVVLHDDVGAHPADDPDELLLAVPRAADQLLPYRFDPGLQLLDRRLLELRRRVADEVLPELPGIGVIGVVSVVGRRRGEVDQVLGKAERREPSFPRRLGGENHVMAAAAQHIADPDAVVRGPVGALRHEQDSQRPFPHRRPPGLRS